MTDKDLLTQEEIDALLTGVGKGEVSTDDVDEPLDEAVRDYDLASQDRIVRAHLPTLEVINEKFARLFRGALNRLLRFSVDVGVGGVRIIKYSEYVQTLYVPTSINLVRLAPMLGQAMFVFDAKLIYKLVDQYFGGAGKGSQVEGRDFSPTETRVVDRLLKAMLEDFGEAWKELFPLQISQISREVNPSLVSAIGAGEIIVVSTFRLEIESGGGGGEIHIALPYSMLEPYRKQLDAIGQQRSRKPDERWLFKMEHRLLEAPIPVNCTIIEKQIRLRELVNFSVGDVIPVDMPDVHIVAADGSPLFQAKLGDSKGNLALEYVDPV